MKNSKSTSKRWLASACVVGAISVLMSSCLKDTKVYNTPPAAAVTFIQTSTDLQPLDLYLDNNLVNRYGINYGDNIDYFNAFTGSRKANFFKHGTLDKIFSDTLTLKADLAYSLFLANKGATPEIVVLKDTVVKPATGNSSVRFINLSPDAGSVDLVIKGGATVATNKAYKGVTTFLPLTAAKAYTFEIHQAGTATVLYTLPVFTLNPGFVYTVYFYGLKAGSADNDKLKASIMTNAYFY